MIKETSILKVDGIIFGFGTSEICDKIVKSIKFMGHYSFRRFSTDGKNVVVIKCEEENIQFLKGWANGIYNYWMMEVRHETKERNDRLVNLKYK